MSELFFSTTFNVAIISRKKNVIRRARGENLELAMPYWMVWFHSKYWCIAYLECIHFNLLSWFLVFFYVYLTFISEIGHGSKLATILVTSKFFPISQVIISFPILTAVELHYIYCNLSISINHLLNLTPIYLFINVIVTSFHLKILPNIYFSTKQKVELKVEGRVGSQIA